MHRLLCGILTYGSRFGFGRLLLFYNAVFVVRDPFANLFAIFILAFIPKLTVLVVTFPESDLDAVLERASLQWLTVFTPPFPVSVKFAFNIFACGLELSVLQVEFPWPLSFTLFQPSLTRDSAVGKQFFVRSVGRRSCLLLHFCYFEFLEKAQKQGINIPIIPGILPITSYAQIERITTLSGCKLPAKLAKKLTENKDNNETIKQTGIEFAVNQCNELLKSGVHGIHFYPLNKAFAVKSVLENLKIEHQKFYV